MAMRSLKISCKAARVKVPIVITHLSFISAASSSTNTLYSLSIEPFY